MRNSLFGLFICCSFTLFAQERPIAEVSQSELMTDIMKIEVVDGLYTEVIWFPEVYWEMYAAQNNMSEEDMNSITRMFQGYSLFVAFVGKIDPSTKSWNSYSSEKLAKTLSVTYEGKTYKPLGEDELTSELNLLTQIMQPMFAQMFGSMGEGFHCYFFDIRDNDLNPLIDPKKDTDLEVKAGKEKLMFNLPVAALFENKTCPEDQQEYPYNYNYCPIHGKPLK